MANPMEPCEVCGIPESFIRVYYSIMIVVPRPNTKDDDEVLEELGDGCDIPELRQDRPFGPFKCIFCHDWNQHSMEFAVHVDRQNTAKIIQAYRMKMEEHNKTHDVKHEE